MNSLKYKTLNEIEKNVDYFQKIGVDQYKMKCPFCGDNDRPNHGHLYLKCGNDPTEPILYHCFLCNKSGRVNNAFLSKLNIQLDVDIHSYYNKLPNIKKDINILTGEVSLASPQYKYLSDRLDTDFSVEELEAFRIVWDMDRLIPYITNPSIKNTLPSNLSSISFLSSTSSLLLTRTFSDDGSRWKKTTLFPSDASFYIIKQTIDLFQPNLVVNIAEGVFDVISIYKHYSKNSINIATLGSDYCKALEYALALGCYGGNTEYNIYLDSDINLKMIRNKLKNYKWLVNKIVLYKNSIGKDYGVPIDEIKLLDYAV